MPSSASTPPWCGCSPCAVTSRRLSSPCCTACCSSARCISSPPSGGLTPQARYPIVQQQRSTHSHECACLPDWCSSHFADDRLAIRRVAAFSQPELVDQRVPAGHTA